MQREGDRIDLEITDYLMPEMNGDELCTNIRHELEYQELPVIFLSGMAEKDQILKMFRAGASDFIVKPFSMDEVQARAAVHINAKVLGDQLRSNVRELKKAHAMKNKFLSIGTHDLRAPLAGIDGLTNLIMMDEDLSEENQDYLKLIKSYSELLFSIINDLLELGRAESDNACIEMTSTDLEENLNACILNLQHLASPKKIELKTDFSQSPEGNSKY